ncbi:MAG: glycogen debranching enzyme family protein [Bacteroidales bacterium]|nr:glycogen debranching enzyme family protein [Bacteroidales bacterium]
MAFLKFNKHELVNLSYSLKREILCANKTGAYCNTSIVTCNTRRYHGLLGVPIDQFGGHKYVLLSSLDESLVVGGKQFNLGIHRYGDIYEPRGHKYIVDFNADPIPEIVYKVGGILFSKSILLVPGRDQVMVRYELLEAPSAVELQLKPFLAFRRIHDLTHQNAQARTDYREVRGGVAFCLYEGFPELHLQMNTAKASFKYAPYWYNGITYSDEYRRGFDCKEDLLVPGQFSVVMKEGESVIFSASVCEVAPRTMNRVFADGIAQAGEITSFHDQLVHCADLLKRDRGGRKQITAGYSWLYTGLLRETLRALPGLTLYANGDKQEFEDILDNLIADEQERLFHKTTQVEAPLTLPCALQSYIDFGADARKVWKKYGETVKGIIESYAPGCREEVTLHPNGLLWAQKDHTALSWMNAYINGNPVTERAGYQVETNAFWYNALSFAIDMERRFASPRSAFITKWTPVRDICGENFQPTFWIASGGYLADYVDNAGQNHDVRPNQLYALWVPYSPVDDEVTSSVLHVIDNELVTKRGIRTLSPRDVKYKGVYEGTQIERDLAYQQGCAWPFLLEPYIAVAFRIKGVSFFKRAEWLCEGFFKEDLGKHGVGAFSELYDGDPPHEPHGAISSALSTAALLSIDYMMDQYRED